MPKVIESVSARFAELAIQANHIPLESIPGSGTPRAQAEPFYAWAASAHHAIEGVFGKQSSHCARFEAEMGRITGNFVYREKLEALRGIFLGAKSDVDGGHLFNLQASFSGEILADFVALAKAAQGEGHHTVAGVLACAALEDSLKRYATANGLQVEDKTMEDVVNALKTRGLVSGAQKTLLGTMPKIRNHAMHADWNKLTKDDVGSVIGIVEQFIVNHFS